jgi:hypothetical protein
MLVEKVRTLWTDMRGEMGDDDGAIGAEDPGQDAAAAEPAGESMPDSRLFSCPECDAVYLALEKERCSSCRAEVTEVRGSLADD